MRLILHVMKILIPILLLIASNSLSAQYLHYEDRSQINKNAKPAKPVRDTITRVSEPVAPAVYQGTYSRVLIALKGNLVAPVAGSITVNDLLVPIIDSEVVYHTWPDKCPGMAGSIPVLNNYVPPLMVLKLTEIYQGHLYAITTIKIDRDELQYELKVCVNGVIRYDFADEDGIIVAK